MHSACPRCAGAVPQIKLKSPASASAILAQTEPPPRRARPGLAGTLLLDADPSSASKAVQKVGARFSGKTPNAMLMASTGNAFMAEVLKLKLRFK